ncbi:MAG: hypothetical protein WC355_02005 [Candidatus Omnitrophota bacterium]|jgi:hypothetical protein
MLRLLRKGQSTAEYAIVIGLVIGAAVAMQIYVKRGLQAKMKQAVDYNDPAAQSMLGGISQYEPEYMTTTGMVSKRDATEKVKTTVGGGFEKAILGEEVTSREGTQEILAP